MRLARRKAGTRCGHCRSRIEPLPTVTSSLMPGATGIIGHGWQHASGAVYCRRRFSPRMAEPQR